MATLGEQLDIQLAAFATIVGNDMQALEALTGALVDLQTQDKTNLVAAINEVFFNVGDLSALTTDQKTSLVLSVNEVITKMGDLVTLNTTDKNSLVEAINEVFSLLGDTDTNLDDVWEAIGNLSSLNTSAKTSLVLAINEVLLKQGNIASLTTSNKTSTVSAINEVKVLTEDNIAAIETVDDKVDDNADEIIRLAGLIGDVNSLDTADKVSLVRAVNEVLSNQGVVSELDTTNKTSLVSAINEVWARANKSSFWGGYWYAKTWLFNEMSRQGNWLGIVNNSLGTTAPLEPQNNGEEEDSINEELIFTEVNDVSVVKMVHRLTITAEGFSKKLDIKAVEFTADTIARITVWNTTTDVAQVYSNVVLGSDTWTLITALQKQAAIGDVIEFWFEIYNSALIGAIDGLWNSDLATGIPASSEFTINNLTIPTVAEIHHTDKALADRSTELDGVGIGSILHITETGDLSRYIELEVDSIDTAGVNSTKYNVSLINNGPKDIRTDRECSIEIDNPVTVPTKYYKATDYYLGVTNQPSFGTITTELYFDGVQQVSATDGYGILFTYQKADFSADWDIMSDGSTSGIAEGVTADSTLVYDAETDTYYAKPTADGQSQDIGQEVFFRAINDSLTNAYALNPKVFLSLRADETYPKWESCTKAKAGDVINGSKFGLNTTDALITGEKKFKCTTLGKLNGVNTSAWPANTQLYIDPITEGDLTSTKPDSNIYPIAKVLVQHATDGVLDVNAISSSKQDKDVTPYSQSQFFFTADIETVLAPGSFRQVLLDDPGIVAESVGFAAVSDNAIVSSDIQFLTETIPVESLYRSGYFEAFIHMKIDDYLSNEKLYIEAYLADADGYVIDSGIANQSLGSLGVKTITLYQSDILNLEDTIQQYVTLNTFVPNDYTIPANHRFRFVIRCEKVGTAGGVKTFSIYSGSSHSTRIEGLVQLDSDDVNNKSTAPGNDVTEALTGHETRLVSSEAINVDHETRITGLETGLAVTWAVLVAIGDRKTGDKYILTDTIYAGTIVLDSAKYFTWVDDNSGLYYKIEII